MILSTNPRSLLIAILCSTAIACSTENTPSDSKSQDDSAIDAISSDASKDNSMVDDLGQSNDASIFACGETQNCSYGEYCMSTLPGVCGGDPVPDSGTCPPNCTPTTCGGGGLQTCICTSYSCVALPTGCTNCSCFTPPSGCNCTDGQNGAVYVNCAMP